MALLLKGGPLIHGFSIAMVIGVAFGLAVLLGQLDLVEHRQQRLTYRQIADELQLAASTVGRLLRRAGLNRLSELEPRPVPRRDGGRPSGRRSGPRRRRRSPR
mgnify:CR=1 FL=1